MITELKILGEKQLTNNDIIKRYYENIILFINTYMTYCLL